MTKSPVEAEGYEDCELDLEERPKQETATSLFQLALAALDENLALKRTVRTSARRIAAEAAPLAAAGSKK